MGKMKEIKINPLTLFCGPALIVEQGTHNPVFSKYLFLDLEIFCLPIRKFVMSISLQPYVGDLLNLLSSVKLNSAKVYNYVRFKPLGCKDRVLLSKSWKG